MRQVEAAEIYTVGGDITHSLVNKKKICGILQETTFNKKVKFIVIGIGINLIKNPKIKNYPTTNILKETGIKVKKMNLIKNIEKNYIKNLKLFVKKKLFDKKNLV